MYECMYVRSAIVMKQGNTEQKAGSSGKMSKNRKVTKVGNVNMMPPTFRLSSTITEVHMEDIVVSLKAPSKAVDDLMYASPYIVSFLP